MSELKPIYGVELIADRAIFHIVRIETMTRACLATSTAQMTAESIADAMNAAHYRATGQEWTRPTAMPLFVTRTPTTGNLNEHQADPNKA